MNQSLLSDVTSPQRHFQRLLRRAAEVTFDMLKKHVDYAETI